MSTNCIFCKIIAGKCLRRRSTRTRRFWRSWTLGPIIKGHHARDPKHHVDPITNAPPACWPGLIQVVQKIAQAQMNGLKAHGVNIMQANGAVGWTVRTDLHFQSFRDSTDGAQVELGGKKYDSIDEMKRVAERARKTS